MTAAGGTWAGVLHAEDRRAGSAAVRAWLFVDGERAGAAGPTAVADGPRVDGGEAA
ncbi:hypothetical protein [Sphingomonas sp.]|uniref:hypothetical protein n=1 Tax=Sphingomonas sp. TaxID=28214 RepID=UPI003B0024DD